ncbi:UvrD-helicase domain-containing protein [Vibrio vulnificus]|uniref:UvrD-helicase domain-containing protein n=1 Tax=Vibrio vulnificus TaxID=672 RepID=UPI001A1DB1AD|nr:UvrD-helicase domain-containing protein [Vibrio vulnificus]MDS1842661.1 UvrD-helicase domain-containing protein [Vibrio vulnificus]HAS8282683.1 hypothetical protein [Vibrio vulnificus]
MTDQLAKSLAEAPKSGYIIAPAGFGKTFLIAESVKSCTGKQLILTHTFAGVDSIKNKLTNQNVPSSQYHVDTIASFALKWVKAYPKRANWVFDEPETKAHWSALYESATLLFSYNFIEQVFASTYSGVFVDEYQDCSDIQHNLILKLVKLKPTRMIGDPLQAIFEFDGQKVVNWDTCIIPKFDKLGELKTPWRWKLAGTEQLGEWLYKIREEIAKGDMPKAPKELACFHHVHYDLEDMQSPNRLTVFKEKAKEAGKCIVVYPGSEEYKRKTHALSKCLSGMYTSIEEVEGKALIRTVDKVIKAKSNNAKLVAVVDLAKSCMTSVGGVLPKKTIEGQTAKVTTRTRYPSLVASANEFLANGNIATLMAFVKGLSECTETKVYRRDPFSRFISVLGYAHTLPLAEAIKQYRQDFRHRGRPVRMDNQIGTTLLVKGLEYNHCIVTYPTRMSPKEFYVALTRGTHSITVISEP